MFPPAAPDNFSDMRPGPTSGYFQRQERALFAQAGKEVVRIRIDVDLQPEPSPKSQAQCKISSTALIASSGLVNFCAGPW
jgi:hypothetical protein